MGGKKLAILFVFLGLFLTFIVISPNAVAKPGDTGTAGSFRNKGKVALSITKKDGQNIPESMCPVVERDEYGYATIDNDFKGGVFGPNGRCNWGEYMLTMAAPVQKKSFCLDWRAIYIGGETYEEIEPVKFLTDRTYTPSLGWRNYSGSKEKAEEALKKLALFYYYLTNKVSFGSNSEGGVYYFGQTLIWRYLNDFYGWDDYAYWVETADKYENNKNLFPNPNASSEDKKKWEDKLIEDAVSFTVNGEINGKSVKEFEADLDKIHIWWPKNLSGVRRQPQIQFDDNPVKEKMKYDFSLDSACVGCDKTGASDVSYVIQDVDNWKLLEKLNGLEDDPQNTGNQMCREEFHVSFPDDSKVYVESGGYFTINEDVLTNNFKPVHIDRIIKCRTNNGTTLSDGNTDSLKGKYCGSGLGDAGNVKIWYSEEGGSGYNAYTYGWENMEKTNSVCGVSKDSEGTAVLVMSSDYKLNEKVFRYIRKGTAKPTSTKSDGDYYYTTVPYPNFPVHFDHKASSNDEIAGKISVKFDFPSDSELGKIYNTSNDSLLLKDQTADNLNEANIYKLYKEKASEVLNDEINSITIKNSACSKMYGFNGNGFSECVNERAGSASKKTSICIERNNKGAGDTNGYTCIVLMNPSNDNGGDCKIISTEGTGKYTGPGGSIVSKTQFINSCCTKDNYKILGVEYDFENNVCKPSDGTCNQSNASAFGMTWARRSDGTYGCCTQAEMNNGTCGGGTCDRNNVGTGAYANMTWAKRNSTGEYDCCTKDEIINKVCGGSGKIICRDGVNGTCGVDAKCVCDADNKCPNDHDNGQCPTTETEKGCSSGAPYKIDGQAVDEDKYAEECCNSSNAESVLHRDWNDAEGVCCSKGETYNPLTGKCIKSCDTCDEAELCCSPNLCGYYSNDSSYCSEIGSEWDGSRCLVCHGKPGGKCEDATCKDQLVYRTVDLDNPFIGEEGSVRNTGANWAALSPDGIFYDSKANNAIVKEVFEDDVYNDSHIMYKFTLDMDLIDDIRRYNNEQKSEGGYTDFTLKCENGTNCKSQFIRNVIPNEKKSGRCLNGSTDPICR